MKTLSKISAAVLLICFSSRLYSNISIHSRWDTLLCLEITGNIVNSHDGPIKSCKVELITSAGIVDSMLLDDGAHKFRFFLKKNNWYAIRVSKTGYFPKLVEVNTWLPVPNDYLWQFEFKTELISVTDSLIMNKDAIDFPIAIVYFEKKEMAFVHNSQYTAQVKHDIYQPDNKMASTSNHETYSILRHSDMLK